MNFKKKTSKKPTGQTKESFNYNPLTDNFKANMVFMAAGLLFTSLSWGVGRATSSSSTDFNQLLLITAGYFFGSYWLSPDLDHIENRPGKFSFPIKPLLKILRHIHGTGGRAGRVLFAVPLALAEVFHGTLNAVWRMMWQPFASMVTHRGIIHWPVIGTLLKWYWIAVLAYAISKLCILIPQTLSPNWVHAINIQDMLPISPREFVSSPRSLFGSLFSLSFRSGSSFVALGLVAADLTHIAVDAWDSRGRNFVPPAIIAPRGIFFKIFQALSVFWKM